MSEPRGPFSIDGAGMRSESLIGPEGKNVGHLLLLGKPGEVSGTVMGTSVFVVARDYVEDSNATTKFLRYLLACSDHEEPFDLKAHVPRIERLLRIQGSR